jgi:competence protein ComEC
MRHTLFYIITFGFIIGVAARSFIEISFSLSLLFFFASFSIVVYSVAVGFVYRFREIKTYSSFFISIIFIFSITLGITRYSLFAHDTGDAILKTYINKKIAVEGSVITEPSEREKNIKFVVELDHIRLPSTKTILIKKTSITTNDAVYSKISYGDRVTVSGSLALPENFESESGRIFKYREYLKKDKIFYEIKNPTVTIVSSGGGNIVYKNLFLIKNYFLEKLDQTLPFPESGFAAGIIVAGKRALPKDVLEDFQKAGALQVVVLSGYNVTIIAESLMKLLAFLPKFFGMGIGIVGIILFTIMAGGSATIVRGSIMAILVLLSKYLKRDYKISRSLLIAAVGMLLLNPMLLLFDPSFQLSFLATIGLIYSTPIAEKIFFFLPERFNIRSVIAATMATQIFVTPYLLYSTREISLVAVPVNFLLSLVLPITMLLCFVTGCLACLHLILALPVSFGAVAFLTSEIKLVHFFAFLPYASVALPLFPGWLLVISYICYSVILIFFHRKKPHK